MGKEGVRDCDGDTEMEKMRFLPLEAPALETENRLDFQRERPRRAWGVRRTARPAWGQRGLPEEGAREAPGPVQLKREVPSSG